MYSCQPNDNVCLSKGLVINIDPLSGKEKNLMKINLGASPRIVKYFLSFLFQEKLEVLFLKKKNAITDWPQIASNDIFDAHFDISVCFPPVVPSPPLGDFFCVFPSFTFTPALLLPPSLSIFINTSFGVFCSLQPKMSPDCFQEDHSRCPRQPKNFNDIKCYLDLL